MLHTVICNIFYFRDEDARYLISVAEECLFTGISACGPEEPFRKIGHAIYRLCRRRSGITIIPNICGHGIGRSFHGPPDIYPTINNYPGTMRPGMVFTIEPCVSLGGSGSIKTHPSDSRTIVTVEDTRTAQFEHTVLITERGVEILT